MTVSGVLGGVIRSPGVSMGAGRLAIAMLGMLATPLYSRVLEPAEYGKLSLAIAVAAAASTAPTQWLTAATLRFAPTAEAGRIKKRIVAGLALSAIPSAAVALGLGLIALGKEPVFIMLLVMYALAEAAYTTFWVASRAKLSLGTYIVGGIARNSVALVLVVVCASYIDIDAQVVLACMLASSFLAACLLTYTKGWSSGATGPPPPILSWLKYGWPLILNYAFTYGLMYTDRFIIARYHGKTAVGVYAATYDVLYAMITLPTALVGLALVPQLFAAQTPESRTAKLRLLRGQTFGCAMGILVVILVTWPFISRALIGPEVRNGNIWVSSGLAVSFAIASVRYQYFNIVLQLRLKTKLLSSVTGAALILNVLLNVILVPKHGISGAVVATLISSTFATISAYFITRIYRDASYAHEQDTEAVE